MLDTKDVSTHLKKMRPYREWLRENSVRVQGSPRALKSIYVIKA